MIATAALAGYLLTCSQKRIFRAQAVAKWRAVYWMTAALAALAVAYKNGLFAAQSAH
ncbi:hypothetical protein [uncultured Campylobacter sp.]|uniref:hypothetical protein n=1 Tax=uncultured Campylobacter sp. TaxID=218934 RepID=UPI0026312C9D|nr:hypothetical protein [uncultured Campylobacter sp.]